MILIRTALTAIFGVIVTETEPDTVFHVGKSIILIFVRNL